MKLLVSATILLSFSLAGCTNANSESQFRTTISKGCAVTENREVKCWGDDILLYYGEGQQVDQGYDVPSDLGEVTQVSSEDGVTCAVQVSGVPRCWGGRGDPVLTKVPSYVDKVLQVDVGSDHTCAINNDRELVCWGGLYAPGDDLEIPEGLGKVRQVSVGTRTCVVTEAENLKCWGKYPIGVPQAPEGLGTVKQVSTGAEGTCVVTTDDEAKCWGISRNLQPPSDLGKVSEIDVYFRACAITKAELVRCWGSERQPPSNLGQVTQISVGWSRDCALLKSGLLRCWPEAANDLYSGIPIPGPPSDLGKILSR